MDASENGQAAPSRIVTSRNKGKSAQQRHDIPSQILSHRPNNSKNVLRFEHNWSRGKTEGSQSPLGVLVFSYSERGPNLRSEQQDHRTEQMGVRGVLEPTDAQNGRGVLVVVSEAPREASRTAGKSGERLRGWAHPGSNIPLVQSDQR